MWKKVFSNKQKQGFFRSQNSIKFSLNEVLGQSVRLISFSEVSSMTKQHEEHNIRKNLTSETKLEGIGTVRVYGELNLEKLVDRLLKSSLVR